MEFIGAICICVFGVEESDKLTDQLREVFLKLIYKCVKRQPTVGCCSFPLHKLTLFVVCFFPLPFPQRVRPPRQEDPEPDAGIRESDNRPCLRGRPSETFSSLLRLFFFQIGCCGAKGSEDYNDALKPVPQECRDPTTGIEYR